MTATRFRTRRIPLGIDLDSTIADFSKSAMALLKEHVDETFTIDQWTTKRIDKCLGSLADQCLREAMAGEEFWRNLDTLPGVIKELVKLMPKYEIHIITQRHERITELTRDWCCSQEVPYDTITIVEDRADKVPAAKEFSCLGFIDDDDDICEDMLSAGLVTAQLIWPWNHQQEGLIRMPDWNSLAYALDLKLQDKERRS